MSNRTNKLPSLRTRHNNRSKNQPSKLNSLPNKQRKIPRNKPRKMQQSLRTKLLPLMVNKVLPKRMKPLLHKPPIRQKRWSNNKRKRNNKRRPLRNSANDKNMSPRHWKLSLRAIKLKPSNHCNRHKRSARQNSPKTSRHCPKHNHRVPCSRPSNKANKAVPKHRKPLNRQGKINKIKPLSNTSKLSKVSSAVRRHSLKRLPR